MVVWVCGPGPPQLRVLLLSATTLPSIAHRRPQEALSRNYRVAAKEGPWTLGRAPSQAPPPLRDAESGAVLLDLAAHADVVEYLWCGAGVVGPRARGGWGQEQELQQVHVCC